MRVVRSCFYTEAVGPVDGAASSLCPGLRSSLPCIPGSSAPLDRVVRRDRDIALTYLQLLEQSDLRDVLVVGSSIGSWIASEMAVREHAHQRHGAPNAVGINVGSAPTSSPSPPGLIAYAFRSRRGTGPDASAEAPIRPRRRNARGVPASRMHDPNCDDSSPSSNASRSDMGRGARSPRAVRRAPPPHSRAGVRADPESRAPSPPRAARAGPRGDPSLRGRDHPLGHYIARQFFGLFVTLNAGFLVERRRRCPSVTLCSWRQGA